MLAIEGAYCAFPRAAYDPADLSPEYHPAVREYFRRWALRDMLPEARDAVERRGMEERADEAASEAYLFWLQNRTPRVPKGAHHAAMKGVRVFFQRSGWHGRTGQRRAARRAVTAERIAQRERMRERHNPTPEAVAAAVERIALTPCHGRKAYRLAKAIGLPGVRELVREACGFADPGPATFTPAPIPAPLPATPGDGTAWRAAAVDWIEVGPGQFRRV